MSNADSPRTQRQPPPGLSDRDTAIIRSVNRRAHYLDKGFNLCGIHFGWSFIIGSHHHSTPPTYRSLALCEHTAGIIPVVGDAADAILGYFLVIRKARKAEYVSASLTLPVTIRLTTAPSQYTMVANAAYDRQPRHRELGRARPYRRRRGARRLPRQLAQRDTP